LKKILSLLVISAVSLLGGCDFGKEYNPSERNGAVESEPQPFPVMIDDVTINESPTEIVCLSPALTEVLFEFGEIERLIGRSVYCDYPLSAKDAEAVGAGIEFDAEKIIQLRPDLLLLTSPITQKDIVSLEREGIPTVVIPAPNNLEEFRSVYRLVGLILYGVFTGAEEGETVFSNITLACNNPDVVDLGNFVYITENMSLATGDTLESSVLSCFGNNIAKDGNGYVFDKNKLLENQPDVILLNGIYSENDLLSDEVFSQLNAVKEHKIITLNNAYFERPSSRIITLISDMAAAFNDLKIPGNTDATDDID
jgi:iron complex transport system substrate-binding protein